MEYVRQMFIYGKLTNIMYIYNYYYTTIFTNIIHCQYDNQSINDLHFFQVEEILNNLLKKNFVNSTTKEYSGSQLQII